MLHALIAPTTFAGPRFEKPPKPYPCADATACARPGHDPSALQRTQQGYYVTLVTGSGAGEAFGMKYLDRKNYSAGWHQGDDSFLVPQWLLSLEPWKSRGCKPACPFWAPDLPSNHLGASDELTMYYSVPPLDGGRDSGCIGRATGTFHPPVDERAAFIDWKDAGAPVLCSNHSLEVVGGPHNIDPSVMRDGEGRLWLTYGSWSSTGRKGGGVWMVELDNATGMLGTAVRPRSAIVASSTLSLTALTPRPTPQARKQCGTAFPYCWSATNPTFRNVANNPQRGGDYADTNAVEASYAYYHPGLRKYFLFVNWFW